MDGVALLLGLAPLEQADWSGRDYRRSNFSFKINRFAWSAHVAGSACRLAAWLAGWRLARSSWPASLASLGRQLAKGSGNNNNNGRSLCQLVGLAGWPLTKRASVMKTKLISLLSTACELG